MFPSKNFPFPFLLFSRVFTPTYTCTLPHIEGKAGQNRLVTVYWSRSQQSVSVAVWKGSFSTMDSRLSLSPAAIALPPLQCTLLRYVFSPVGLPAQSSNASEKSGRNPSVDYCFNCLGSGEAPMVCIGDMCNFTSFSALLYCQARRCVPSAAYNVILDLICSYRTARGLWF